MSPDEKFPKVRGELIQGCLDLFSQLGQLESGTYRRLIRRNFEGWPVIISFSDLIDREGLDLFFSPKIYDVVRSDFEQPCTEFELGLVGRERGIGFNKNLLCEIERKFTIPDHATDVIQ
jgi:hypothetical protein